MLYKIVDQTGRVVLEYSSKAKALAILDCLNAFAAGSSNHYALKEN